MKRTYKIEFYKNVPIVETEGAKWMFDTGCPISSPNFTLNPKIGEFLGLPGLRIMGTDRLGDYVLIDYSAKVIVSSDDPIPFEGASVPLCHGFMHSCPLVEMTVGGQVKSCYIDTGAAYSYLRGLDKDRFESADIAEECDLSGSRCSAFHVNLRGASLKLSAGRHRTTNMESRPMALSATTSSSRLLCS